jgi:hypothetical protein
MLYMTCTSRYVQCPHSRVVIDRASGNRQVLQGLSERLGLASLVPPSRSGREETVIRRCVLLNNGRGGRAIVRAPVGVGQALHEHLPRPFADRGRVRHRMGTRDARRELALFPLRSREGQARREASPAPDVDDPRMFDGSKCVESFIDSRSRATHGGAMSRSPAASATSSDSGSSGACRAQLPVPSRGSHERVLPDRSVRTGGRTV